MNFSFSFEGLDEMKKDLDDMLSKYPDETESAVYSMAGTFTKDVNAKMSETYAKGKRPLPDSWHRTREKAAHGGFDVGVEIENQAPHWHLVENGHSVIADPRMYAAFKKGELDHSKATRKHKSRNKTNTNLKKLGWDKGKGYCQKTRDEWNAGRFEELVEKFLRRMVKKHGL